MDINLSNQHYRVRKAKQSDNQDLCRLLSTVLSESNITLVEKRDPDFFRLRRIQDPDCLFLIVESTSTNEVIGCVTFVTRIGWVAGRKVKIGYICDVRISAQHRRHSIIPRLFRQIAKEALANDYDFAYSSIVDSNEHASKIKVIGGGKLWTCYQMKSVTFFGNVDKPSIPVYRANVDDMEEIAHFLQTQESHRFGGYQITKNTLEERFSEWEGFGIENFFYCRDDKGQICATAAPWDSSVLRRSCVMAYSGSMRWLKNLYNLEASLRRKMKLPKPGEHFHYLTLTHLNIANDDPLFFNELLRGIYQYFQNEPFHFMSAFIPEGSPLEKGFSGMRTQTVDFRLHIYLNSNSWVSTLDLKNYQPGFEMALH